jgi:predicted PurR-regulated permease PerM
MQDSAASHHPRHESSWDWTVFRRTLIVIGTIGLALALWQTSNVLLLSFGAVLFAIVLRAAARPITRYTKLSDGPAVGLVLLLILCLFLGMAALFGSTISSQFSDLSTRLPGSLGALEEQLGVKDLSQKISSQLGSSSLSIFQSITNIALSVFNAAANALVLVIAGVFIALKPSLYRRGLLLLFPRSNRAQMERTFGHMGGALQHWLLGQLVSMTLVGVLTCIALSLIGLPSAFALGVIAGVTEFIPLLGPILGGIPAVLIASGEGFSQVLWTLAAILAVQQIESNMIVPIVQRRAVSLPPALTLLAVLAFGALFGTMGVLLATPLAVVAYVAVTELYVRDALGEDVQVPGSAYSQSASAS